MAKRGRPPKLKTESQKELDKVEKQFDQYEKDITSLSQDEMNKAPKQELEPQTKLSQNELQNKDDITLKPHKIIFSREKFNETYREDYEFQKQYVRFIAENKEIPGEIIDMWTKPFPGMPAEEWKVPVNKPVFGPRYVAEAIRSKSYHILEMNPDADRQNFLGDDLAGQYYGKMVAKRTIPRLTAEPVSNRKSVFVGDLSF